MNDTVAATSLEQLADEIAHTLARATMLDGRAYIRTPVLFPSGATAVVVIEEEGGGRYRVSDLGQGFDEASQLGVASGYRRQAQEVAGLSGLKLEGGAFVLPATEADQLLAGTMTVANAPVRAQERAMLRATSRPPQSSVERLVTRLRTVFPKAVVEREVELRGLSIHAWAPDALVTTETGRAAHALDLRGDVRPVQLGVVDQLADSAAA